MPDPYHTLGVAKTATAEEIKAAWRKLAKKYHPDVNQGRKDIEQKFKDASSAYELLSDPTKRARYDRGEIDAEGKERGFAGFGGAHGNGHGGFGSGRFHGGNRRYGQGGGAGDAFGGSQFGGLGADFFAEFFGSPEQEAHSVRAGRDVLYDLKIPFIEACLGGTRRLKLASGKTVDLRIPPATESGHKLRLKSLGEEGSRGRGTGDAIVTIEVDTHPLFTREGHNIIIDVPISLQEAVTGAQIRIPTLDGNVDIRVPKDANTGTTLRLRGKGIPNIKGSGAGDMLARLRIMLPDPMPDHLIDIIKKMDAKHFPTPRNSKGW